MKKFYRYDIIYSTWSMFPTDIELHEVFVIKETKESFWVWFHPLSDKKKLIRKDAINKQRWYCAETEIKALDQFINRTKKRIAWMEYYLENCKTAINIADHYKTCEQKKDLFKL